MAWESYLCRAYDSRAMAVEAMIVGGRESHGNRTIMAFSRSKDTKQKGNAQFLTHFLCFYNYSFDSI